VNPEQPNYHPGENSALQDYYASSSGNSLPEFRDNLQVPSSSVKNPKRIEFLTPEDGIDWFTGKVGNELPILAVY